MAILIWAFIQKNWTYILGILVIFSIISWIYFKGIDHEKSKVATAIQTQVAKAQKIENASSNINLALMTHIFPELYTIESTTTELHQEAHQITIQQKAIHPISCIVTTTIPESYVLLYNKAIGNNK